MRRTIHAIGVNLAYLALAILRILAGLIKQSLGYPKSRAFSMNARKLNAKNRASPVVLRGWRLERHGLLGVQLSRGSSVQGLDIPL